jgi:16S rRNA (guanine527-N7)-methyltransferase
VIKNEELLRTFSQKYLDVLRGTYEGLNLVGIKNDEDFFIKQVVDAMRAVEVSSIFSNKISSLGLVVDVGFGGGFPLLPLAYLMKNIQFAGIETRAKKAHAVEDIAKRLEINNVKITSNRLENILFDRPCVLTFKAVGTCADMLDKIQSSSSELYVFFYKGPQFFELESKDFSRIEKKWELIDKTSYPLEGTEGRWLIGYKRKQAANVPNKSLVNLSSFL